MGQVANCKTCEELTPVDQRNDTCSTISCQVCGNQIFTDVNNALAEVSDKWLADFWRAKYFGKGVYGNNVVFIGNSPIGVVGHVGHDPTVLAQHLGAHGPIGTTTVSRPGANTLSKGEVMESMLSPKEFFKALEPNNKSKYHK